MPVTQEQASSNTNQSIENGKAINKAALPRLEISQVTVPTALVKTLPKQERLSQAESDTSCLTPLPSTDDRLGESLVNDLVETKKPTEKDYHLLLSQEEPRNG
jgi:hypothetical protein